jgi:hypothetical protein
MIEVALLTPECEQDYRRFSLSNPHALIYASLEFRDFLQTVAGGEPAYWIAVRQGRICGALPLFSVNLPGHGRIINSLTWYGSYGGCILADDGDEEVRRALLEKYRSMAVSPEVLTATLIISPFEQEWEATYRETLDAQFTDQRIGQITTLPDEGGNVAERLMMGIAQKTRNLVRKSLKQNFELLVTDSDWAWQFLHDTHEENIQAIGGRSKPWQHFTAIREHILPDQRRIFIARLDGRPVAGMLILYFNRTAEYITPVIKHDYRSQQPLSFLIWHGMLQAIAEGYRYWNWGGTWMTQKTLHHFKAGWGGLDYPYTYFIHAQPHRVQALRTQLKEVQALAPYYYLFPYSLLT